MKHIRKYLWADPYLLQLMTEKEINLSAFFNKAMAAFLDLPEDQSEKILREGIEKVGSYTQLRYLKEIRGQLLLQETAQSEEDTKKAKQNELTKKLTDLGKKLQRTSCYPKILQALQALDSEAWCWDIALQELNSMNSDQYDLHELWNLAIEWYRKCPVPPP